MSDHSPLTTRLIEEGLSPRPVLPERKLYTAFFDIAMDTLTKGAPGLKDRARIALSSAIAIKCESIVNRRAAEQGRAA